MTIHLRPRQKCPLCGTSEHTVYIDFPEISVVKCNGCGFLYSSRVMPDETLHRYYTDGFGSCRHLRGQMVTARCNVWATEKLLGGLLDSVRNVLDVGTGYGFFLKEIRDRFSVKTMGVEISRQEADYARRALSLDVKTALLSDSNIEKGKFDLVTAFEVIEHTQDPRAFIRELIEYAKPGGYCLIMTDNFESRVAVSLGPGFPKWIPHSHISHFCPGSLERLVSEEDMAIVGRLSYTPWELLLRSWYYRIIGIKRMPSESFDLSKTLENEMRGKFKLFQIRRIFNAIWARLQARADLDEAVMYVLTRRPF